jgi:hypothetical protein
MEDPRWERYGAASGILAVLAIIAGFLVFPMPPDVDAATPKVAKYYIDHKDGVRAAIALFTLALLFFTWFLATLRAALNRAEGPVGRLSMLAFGAGLIASALLAVNFGATATAAFRPEQTPAEVTRALNDLGLMVAAVSAFALVASLLATALVVLRTGVLPPWVAWLSGVAALFNAITIASIFTDNGAFAADGAFGFFIPFLLFVVWLLATSIALLRSLGATAAGRPAGGPAAPPV